MKDMVQIPGGVFAMGSDDFYPEEAPVHEVEVDGFWIDEHPVTVAEFRRFVKETGYVTVAERTPMPPTSPEPIRTCSFPGSLVFHPPDHPVDLRDRRTGGRTSRSRVAPSGGTGEHPARARASPGHPCRIGGRRGVRHMDRQGVADRSRVGVRGARRADESEVRMGRGVRPQGQDDGEHVAGRVPVAEPAGRTVSRARRRSRPSRRTVTASSTWPATSGSGRATTSRRSPQRSTPAVYRGTRERHRPEPVSSRASPAPTSPGR